MIDKTWLHIRRELETGTMHILYRMQKTYQVDGETIIETYEKKLERICLHCSWINGRLSSLIYSKISFFLRFLNIS